MNSKLDNEMRTGPLSLGEVVPVASAGGVFGGNYGGASSVAGGACGSIGNGGSSWLQDRITAACQDGIVTAKEITIGQHIDRRIMDLQAQVTTLYATRERLAQVGAINLPVQTLRDALF